MTSATPDRDPAGHMLAAGLEQVEGIDSASGVNGDIPAGTGIPSLPADATPAERDAHWRKHVYLGDSQLQLTLRAVLIGGLTGGLLSVVGLYITLRTGWGLPLTTLATLGTFAVMNALTKATGGKIRPFTMLENNCMTSTATAASSSTGMTIVGCFGGLMLATAVAPEAAGKVGNPPVLAMGAVVFFTAILGICLAVPLKRRMVNDEDLAWPSPRAGAQVLRGLYSDGVAAAKQARMLFTTLAVGGVLGLLRSFGDLEVAFHQVKPGLAAFFKKLDGTIGVPGELTVPLHRTMDGAVWLMNKASGGRLDFNRPDHALQFKGAAIEPGLLLVATGMIVGLRTCISMFLSSLVLYLFLTPAMLSSDAAHVVAVGEHFQPALKITEGAVNPISWGLWGGTALLVSSSLVSLALQWRTILRSFSGLFKTRAGRETDPVADLEVPLKWAFIAGVPAAAGLAISLHFGFGVNPWLGLLALGLSGVVAIVCARSGAETDINPIGAMGKVTQLIYARLPGASGSAAINLVAAGSTSAAGGSAVDMLGDLKTSHLLGANSRKVWLAQLAGVFFGIVPVLAGWYFIVPDADHLLKFPALPAKMWSAVAKLLTDKDAVFYNGALTLIIVCAAIGTLHALVAHFFPKIARRLPSALGLGIGLALPLGDTFAFLVGAIALALWKKGWEKSAVFYGMVVAAGLLSGEAIMKAVVAVISEIPNHLH